MSKFHKAVEIVEKLGFEFVKTDQEANIIIKTPDVIIPSENKRKISNPKSFSYMRRTDSFCSIYAS